MYIEPLVVLSIALLASLSGNVGFFLLYLTRHTRS